MRRFFLSLLAAAMLLPGGAVVKVHTIGDSTMAEYDENTTDKRGWGMYLGSFFDPSFVTVNNRGKSGADTRGFYNGAAYWPSVKNQMSAGDYLLIQFAHNDEGTVTYGMDNLEYAAYCSANSLPAPTDARGTNPQTTFRDYLRLFIDEARALGVTPVLVGPICRKYFSGNTIKRNGQHDLGDKFSKIEDGVLYENQSLPAGDSTMSYVKAMKVVAAEKEVPFIDLTAATRDLYLSYGEAQCTQLLFCTGDNTHTNAMGGNLIARQAAQMLKDAGILADYITIPTSISANPTAIAIGETYSGVAQNKEFLLTGFGLEPASGTVDLRATANLTISTDKENYASTASVDYAGNTLFRKVFVRANYTTGGEQHDTVYITSGDIHLTVPVTASVLSLEGGTRVLAEWYLETKPAAFPLDAICSGPVAGVMTLSLMQATDIKDDVVIDAATGATVVRFHNADEEGNKTAWPTEEIDENAGRYVDFAVTAPATMEVRVTNIRMRIGAYSTSFMKCHINTGFGDGFTDVQTIYEAAQTALPNKEMWDLDLTPTLTIPAGETLHMRVLPWHEHTSGSGKYLLLRDVSIEGQAFEPTEDVEQVPGHKVHPAKRIRNGQFVIERNGVLYNAQGTIIKGR